MTNSEKSKEKKEKNMFARAKHKRLSDAREINLPAITEADEKSKVLKSLSNYSRESTSFDKLENDSSTHSSDSEVYNKININNLGTTAEETILQQGINKSKPTKVEQLYKRKPNHGYEPECETLSEEGRIRAETSPDQVNKTGGNKSQSKYDQSIKSSTIIIPRLDLKSLSSDTGSTETTETHVRDRTASKEMDSPYLPDLKHTCIHGNINMTPRKGENMYQTQNSEKINNRTAKKCILCDINGASTRNKAVQTDVDKLLVEIIYPHEYYDRYSRAGKKLADTKEKEVISICQPVKVVQKPPPQRKMSPVIPVPASTPVSSADGNKSGRKEIESGEIENEDNHENHDKHEKRIKFSYEPRENTKTEFHGHCAHTLNTLIVTTDETGGQKSLHGMKGCVVQKEGRMYTKEHVKRSDYNINSLGIQFSLPEYNSSLRRRKESSCQPVVQQKQYTPRLADPYVPITHPFTHRQSPKQPLFQFTPRNVKSVNCDVMMTHTLAPVQSLEDTTRKTRQTKRSLYTENCRVKSGERSESGDSSRRQRALVSTQEEMRSRSLEKRSKLSLPPIKTAIQTGPIKIGFFSM